MSNLPGTVFDKYLTILLLHKPNSSLINNDRNDDSALALPVIVQGRQSCSLSYADCKFAAF